MSNKISLGGLHNSQFIDDKCHYLSGYQNAKIRLALTSGIGMPYEFHPNQPEHGNVLEGAL